MQGCTFYVNEFNNLQYATKEQIGNMFLMAMEACETEKLPTFDNPMDAMLFDGFKRCLEKGFTRKKNGKNGGAPQGNQNARKIKPNTDFDENAVSCYTPTTIEKRSLPTSKLLHEEEIVRLIQSGSVRLEAGRNEVKRLIKQQFNDDSIVEDVFNGLMEKYNNK